jgi:hypothetical protein
VLDLPDADHWFPGAGAMSKQILPLDADSETLQLLGPARLAYFTPVREYPPLGDKKAAMLLSVNAFMITVTLLFSHRMAELVHRVDPLAWAGRAVLVVWFACMLICAWNAFVALTLPIPSPDLPAHEPDSLAFFKNIAARRYGQYEEELRAMSHRRALRDMLHYNYSLAVLSAEKFRYIRRAVRYLCLAFGCWIFLMVALARA